MRNAICVAFFCALVSAPAFAQAPDKASAQLTTDPVAHFKGGDQVNFKMKLNESLPKGATVDARFSPTAVSEEFGSSCNEPKDADRKELECSLKLSDDARGGEWRIAVVYLHLQGSSWTYNTIATNLKFNVDGPEGPLPTSAVTTIVKK
jgi:hypothetical protein